MRPILLQDLLNPLHKRPQSRLVASLPLPVPRWLSVPQDLLLRPPLHFRLHKTSPATHPLRYISAHCSILSYTPFDTTRRTFRAQFTFKTPVVYIFGE